MALWRVNRVEGESKQTIIIYGRNKTKHKNKRKRQYRKGIKFFAGKEKDEIGDFVAIM